MEQTHTLLIVAGDAAVSSLIGRALTHPTITTVAANSEQSIVNALASPDYAMAVVAGQVGKRGPLVLCDAVKARQREMAVLVVVGEETDVQAERDHKERQLAGVVYVDVRGEAPVERGGRIRGAVLDALRLPEDTSAQGAWLAAQVEAEASPAVPAPVEVLPQTSVAEPVGAVAKDPPPLLLETVTEDDLQFAQRLASQTRGIDFRAPPARIATPEGPERTTHLLRERVRELERSLARMSFIYARRLRDFDGAARRIAELEEVRRSLEQHLHNEIVSWRGQLAERDAKIASLAQQNEVALARLAEASQQLQRSQEELSRREQGFADLLKQAQDAFVALRDQSAQSLANAERALAEESQRKRELEGEKQNLATRLAEGERQVAELEGKLRATDERLVILQKDVDESEVKAEFALAELGKRKDAELAALRAQLAADEEQRNARLERIKEEVLRLRQAHDERAAEASEREKEVAVLKAQLAASDKDLVAVRAELEETKQTATPAAGTGVEIPTELLTQVEGLLERRLTGLEGTVRDAAEQVARQRDLVLRLEQHLSATEAPAPSGARLTVQQVHPEASSRREPREAAATAASESDKAESDMDAQAEPEPEPEPAVPAASQSDAKPGPEPTAEGEAQSESTSEPEPEPTPEAELQSESAPQPELESEAPGEQRPDGEEAATEDIAAAAAAEQTGGKRSAPESPIQVQGELLDRLLLAKQDETQPRPPRVGWKYLAAGGAILATAALLAVSILERSDAPESTPDTSGATATQAAPPSDSVDSDVAGDDAQAAAAAAAPGNVEATAEGEQGSKANVTGEAARAGVEVPAKAGVEAEAERKELRQAMFDAYRKRQWAKAVDFGRRLQAYHLDWEAEYKLAEAYRKAGRAKEATDAYRSFITDYPDNRYVEKAKQVLAELGQ